MDFLCDGTSIRSGNHHWRDRHPASGDRDLVRAAIGSTAGSSWKPEPDPDVGQVMLLEMEVILPFTHISSPLLVITLQVHARFMLMVAV